jgi:hypothetical protein
MQHVTCQRNTMLTLPPTGSFILSLALPTYCSPLPLRTTCPSQPGRTIPQQSLCPAHHRPPSHFLNEHRVTFPTSGLSSLPTGPCSSLSSPTACSPGSWCQTHRFQPLPISPHGPLPQLNAVSPSLDLPIQPRKPCRPPLPWPRPV